MRTYRFYLINGETSEPLATEELPDDLAAQRHASHLGITLFSKQPEVYRESEWKVRATDVEGFVVHDAPVVEGELHPMK